MPKIVECPKCGQDISDSYQSAEPDVGIMDSGWWCEQCDLGVDYSDLPEEDLPKVNNASRYS